ncbi:hypothetical protein BH23ACT3_BH23ACT3_17950 [soil metagenome]
MSIASFNLHWGGTAGGTSQYDVGDACRRLDADVRVFQEVWDSPQAPSQLWVPDDFTVVELEHATFERSGVGVGTWSLVLATRFTVMETRSFILRGHGSDQRRAALGCRLDTGAGEVWVVAVHLTTHHLPLGSLRQLRSLVPQLPTDAPTILAGDHNQWTLPARLVLGQGWVHSPRGPTWPARFPVFQIDHIWGRGFEVVGAEVAPDVGSDHRPIVAELVRSCADR